MSAVPTHGTRSILKRAGAVRPSRVDCGQRDEGARAGNALSRVRDRRAGAGRRRARRRAVRAELRRRSRARAADRAVGGVAASRSRRSAFSRSSARRTSGCTERTTSSASRSAGRSRTSSPLPPAWLRGLGSATTRAPGLITRGLAEISRLACAAGASRETLAGLAGLGDLVLTCNGSAQPQPPCRHRARAWPRLARRAGGNEDGG